MTDTPDDDQPQRPTLRLVSDQPASAVGVQRGSRSAEYVEQSTKWAMLVLTANLLRVARGAGKPHEITAQIGRLVEEMELYRHAFGRHPHVLEYQDWLSIRETYDLDPSEMDRHYAIETIIRGSLQITASRLVDQLTQERAGDTELHNGLTAYQSWREQLRKEMLAASRAAPAPKKKPRSKPTPRTPRSA